MKPPTRPKPVTARDRVAALLQALGAKAAGLWRVRGDHLELEAFVPAPDLPAEVAVAFAQATRRVSLAQDDLGNVRAVNAGAVTVMVAAQIPAEAGSGFWLRAFGASRSVVVPLRAADGRVEAILSVALPSADEPDDLAVAEVVRAHGASLLS